MASHKIPNSKFQIPNKKSSNNTVILNGVERSEESRGVSVQTHLASHWTFRRDPWRFACWLRSHRSAQRLPLTKLKAKWGLRMTGVSRNVCISRGFTLVELLVVIAIIGLLATVSISTYSGYQKKARDGKRKFDLRNLQSSLEQYYSQQAVQQYPNTNSYDTLYASHLGPAPGGQGLLKVKPQDPNATLPYRYLGLSCGTGTCQDYILCADLDNNNDPDRLAIPPPTSNICQTLGAFPGTYDYAVQAP